ncbi:alpha-ketoglutarate-dependent dioxygenase alkB homolog 4 isoform X2 [Ischnura elegans]|nr:alpha-ketoglutarate-dependent dioxygenase alkB homolog 4 isoform X2 [Ischnura elegans]
MWKEHPNHQGEPYDFPGVYIELDYIAAEEQLELIRNMDQLPWDPSQSGRRKQNYGPKCNFKKRKMKPGDFNGFPKFSEFIQERFRKTNILDGFMTVEQCSLEYTSERGASIDPHIDDCWVWGERVVTVNVIGDSMLTLSRYMGNHDRYNLADVVTYPRILSDDGLVVWRPLHADSSISCETPRKKDEEIKFERTEGNDNTVDEGCSDNMLPSDNGNSEESVEDISQDDSKNVCRSFTSYNFIGNDGANVSYPIVRVPMPARSLLVIYGAARYEWEHSVLREDITGRRVCLAYREFTPPFLKQGVKEKLGSEVLEKAANFW